MERMNNSKLLEMYYQKHNIDQLIEANIKNDLFLVRFDKGEIIQHQGDPVDILYFKVDGNVKVSIIQENGKSKLICFLEDFALLGDIEVLADRDYVNQVVALKETYCLGLDMKIHRETLIEDPLFNKNMARALSKIVLSNNQSTSFNLLYSLETRIATYISLAAKDGRFKEKLTDVAETLGTSYRHLQRVLSNLCSKGVLAKEGRTYVIIDKKALSNLANDTISEL